MGRIVHSRTIKINDKLSRIEQTFRSWRLMIYRRYKSYYIHNSFIASPLVGSSCATCGWLRHKKRFGPNSVLTVARGRIDIRSVSISHLKNFSNFHGWSIYRKVRSFFSHSHIASILGVKIPKHLVINTSLLILGILYKHHNTCMWQNYD